MTEQATSIVDESRERFTAARERIDEEISRVQRELKSRRRQVERQLESGRKNIERETRKQVKQLRKGLRGNGLLKQLDSLRTQAEKRVEEGLETLLGTLQIASKQDVKKIDRKLGKLSKRLKEIERVRTTNGRQAPSSV